MSYVDDQLLPGEQIKYRAYLSKVIYVVPTLLSLVLLLPAIPLVGMAAPPPAFLVLFVAVIPVLWAYITHKTSEFAVTDRRVVIKVGWIQRRTLETMLNKVEGIGVDQGIIGRMLGFGTITVTGTGGTKEPFTNIANPLEFRRQVQAQVSRAEDARGVVLPPGAAGVPHGLPRQERECPYCAERILAKARVCKHCGREVEPLATA